MNVAVRSSPDEVTRGFIFADLRGYTALVERHGAVEASHLLERYRALTRDVVAQHGGAEIKTEGDSFYVVLPSASAAVRCGLALAAACASPPDGGTPIAVGVGIHAGESVAHEGGFVGSAVNITARVCAIASAGELLATGTVRELTRSVVTARFVSVGRRQLKGFAEPVELFRVAASLDTAARPNRRTPWAPIAPGRAWLLVALASIAIVASGAVIAAVQGPGMATPSTSGSTAGAGSSQTPDQAFPDSSEQALMTRLPPSIAAGCSRGSNPAPVAAASLRCRMPLGSPPTELSLLWFPSAPNAASARITTDASDLALPAGDCSGGTEGSGSWGGGSVPKGRLACFFDSVNEYWVEWSYEVDGVLARAVGRRTGAGDVFAWWKSNVDELLAAASPGSSSPVSQLPRVSTELLTAPIRPGTYVPNVNPDVASVTIAEPGWTLDYDSEDLLVFDAGGSGPSGIVGLATIDVVDSGSCPDDGTHVIGDRPQDMIEWLQSAPQLEASNPRSVNDLGRSGIAIDAKVGAPPLGGCSGRHPSDVSIWQAAGGSWNVPAGSQLLIEALNDGNRTLTVFFVSPTAEELAAFADGPARKLLDSIVLR